jgi:mannosyltransferase
VVMAFVALWSIGGASLWRDEASTLSAVRRPLPQLWRMLGRTDAVHGLYYLLMWPVARVAGTSAADVRLPSAIAVSAAALGVAVLGRRLVSPRAGLLAGLMFVLLPVTSRYGQEARSYAMVMGLAVLASYLLVRADAAQRPGRWLGWYALVVAVMGWANLMSLLLVPAHALTRLWNARAVPAGADPARPAPARWPRWRGWLVAVSAAGILVSPIAVLAWREQHGTARFLHLTNWGAVASVPNGLIGSWLVLPVAIGLVAAGVWRAGRGHAALTRLALPWLALPAPLLLAVGLFTPVFTTRYVLFCVPALALLAGSGLDRLVTRIAERPAAAAGLAARRNVIAAAAIAVIAAAGLPAQLAYRAPAGHLDNFRLIAQVLTASERPGDAVIYDPPYWRQISAAYPAPFAHLRDIALARTPEQEDDFTGTQVPAGQLITRLSTVHRTWVIAIDPFRGYPPLQSHGWHITSRWWISDFTLILYTRS